jgi:hypothetical protein
VVGNGKVTSGNFGWRLNTKQGGVRDSWLLRGSEEHGRFWNVACRPIGACDDVSLSLEQLHEVGNVTPGVVTSRTTKNLLQDGDPIFQILNVVE